MPNTLDPIYENIEELLTCRKNINDKIKNFNKAKDILEKFVNKFPKSLILRNHKFQYEHDKYHFPITIKFQSKFYKKYNKIINEIFKANPFKNIDHPICTSYLYFYCQNDGWGRCIITKEDTCHTVEIEGIDIEHYSALAKAFEALYNDPRVK